METLDMPEKGPLKALDLDNAHALKDWRASGLGPCVAMLSERQVLGEYPHPDEVGQCPEDILFCFLWAVSRTQHESCARTLCHNMPQWL